MRQIEKDIKEKVLKLLKDKRSYKEISSRTGVCIATIEDWASDWRKQGILNLYIRPGMEFSNKAKLMSNGYYKSIRKRYLSMKWTDKLEKRNFGFNNPTEAIHYYLINGIPRPCAYCGKLPENGKVWGLDRINSDLGHVPGNLVPCCSNNTESKILSCQNSKSRFTLYSWMKANMSRAYGKDVSKEMVDNRLKEIYQLALDLGNMATD